MSFSACELNSLRISALVLQIRSMISFGGFLAECLPCYGVFMVGYYEANVVYGSYKLVAIWGAIDDRNLTVVNYTG